MYKCISIYNNFRSHIHMWWYFWYSCDQHFGTILNSAFFSCVISVCLSIVILISFSFSHWSALVTAINNYNNSPLSTRVLISFNISCPVCPGNGASLYFRVWREFWLHVTGDISVGRQVERASHPGSTVLCALRYLNAFSCYCKQEETY